MPEINEEVDDEYVDEQAVNRNLKGGGKRILFESLLDDFWPWYGDQGNLCQVTVGGGSDFCRDFFISIDSTLHSLYLEVSFRLSSRIMDNY